MHGSRRHRALEYSRVIRNAPELGTNWAQINGPADLSDMGTLAVRSRSRNDTIRCHASSASRSAYVSRPGKTNPGRTPGYRTISYGVPDLRSWTSIDST